MSIHKYLISFVLLMTIASTALAGEGKRPSPEERWNKLSPERQQEITAKAAEQGFNMSTAEGRQAYFDTRKKEHHAFRKEIRALSPEQRQALRAELKDLNPEQRREYLHKRFAKQ